MVMMESSEASGVKKEEEGGEQDKKEGNAQGCVYKSMWSRRWG